MKWANILFFEITPAKKTSQTIIYLAGGGFVLPITSLHYEFIAQIVEETGARLVVPNYPLAPYYHVDDVMAFFKGSLSEVCRWACVARG
ncbi:alpha/beta hydrolase fold domain-containing protein [Listeria fleischmannii]|uniref:Alpha/beta hydrolase n=1 Tax=Listeria fleischmannii FSL S10-1203 TaxID=1265822 RepID=W7DXH8_9LIST|nr:alpha/beta hydrolase fold domain-containing protein [Listeria fleischmannii]EUJ53169.1 alpha/beta hydrolase [Listeria fleischmannii FSL S10-1203]